MLVFSTDKEKYAVGENAQISLSSAGGGFLSKMVRK
jgi:hypothetical protein